MKRALELKACYSVGELARAMGISRFTCYRMLKARDLLERTEGVSRVWLSELQKRAPEPWESMLLVQALRG